MSNYNVLNTGEIEGSLQFFCTTKMRIKYEVNINLIEYI